MFRNTAICRRLLRHWVRLAASRARERVGSRIESKTAIMPMTTSNSISVKPRSRRRAGVPRDMEDPQQNLHRPTTGLGLEAALYTRVPALATKTLPVDV